MSLDICQSSPNPMNHIKQHTDYGELTLNDIYICKPKFMHYITGHIFRKGNYYADKLAFIDLSLLLDEAN